MTDKNNLSKFIELMSQEISDSDLELVNLGKSLGLDLVSFKTLRDSQDDKFVDEIRNRAIKRLKQNNENLLKSSDLFYAGSIDFMVCEEPDGKSFFLLETNGGSNRGLSILTRKQQEIIYDGYLHAIFQALENNKKDDGKALILVGVPINDGLIHEKVLMIEYFRKKLRNKGYSVGIYDINSFSKDFIEDIVFLIADYKQLSTELRFTDNWVIIKDSKISVLIGDGIARRLHNNTFQKLVIEDFRKINTLIVNPIFKITDDKSLTYLASYYAKDILKKYRLKYLRFTKAYSEEELLEKLKYACNTYRKPFIIKPNGGSGGAGVIPIAPDSDLITIRNCVEISKDEFFGKFMKNRNPYPYTIQEMADFSLIDWKNGKHTFDIRIYLSQQNKNEITPIGGLARIARGDYKGNLIKDEFVVNLSGFNGQIEVERGQGLSKKTAKLLNLTIDDFVNLFCISVVMFKSIAENYKEIINFKDWDKLIGE
ncbi:MAG: hypothetical protein ACTSQP_01640 [Promethearchaeota archaeon]